MPVLHSGAKARVIFATILSLLIAGSSAASAEGGHSSTLPFLKEQAQKGNAQWQSALGLKYLLGDEVPVDTEEALKWIRKSAEQGYLPAIDDLADFHWKGSNGVPQDKAEAAKWLRISAARGRAQSQYRLGLIYFFGESVPQDYSEAARWLLKAAEQGHAVSQNNIGLMYSQGKGVPENQADAVKWYARSAAQEYSGAQHNLARKYAAGQGVGKDLVEAYKWFALAALNKNNDNPQEDRNLRDEVAAEMTAAQIAEAERRVSQWKPRPESDSD